MTCFTASWSTGYFVCRTNVNITSWAINARASAKTMTTKVPGMAPPLFHVFLDKCRYIYAPSRSRIDLNLHSGDRSCRAELYKGNYKSLKIGRTCAWSLERVVQDRQCFTFAPRSQLPSVRGSCSSHFPSLNNDCRLSVFRPALFLSVLSNTHPYFHERKRIFAGYRADRANFTLISLAQTTPR